MTPEPKDPLGAQSPSDPPPVREAVAWGVRNIDTGHVRSRLCASQGAAGASARAATSNYGAYEAIALYADPPPLTGPGMAMLSDPNVVHINMLRGGIAKPTPAQIGHLYRREEAAEVVREVIRQNPDAAPDPLPVSREAVDLCAKLRERLALAARVSAEAEYTISENEIRTILALTGETSRG